MVGIVLCFSPSYSIKTVQRKCQKMQDGRVIHAPSLSLTSTSDPIARRCITTSVCPMPAARCNGVRPEHQEGGQPITFPVNIRLKPACEKSAPTLMTKRFVGFEAKLVKNTGTD